MQETLLIIHILAAAAWLGGALLTIYVGPKVDAAGGEGAIAWARLGKDLSMRFFNPATILTLLTGLGLVMTSEAFDWEDTFVTVGLGAIVVAAIIGMGVMAPARNRMLAALQEGDLGMVGRSGAKLRTSSIIVAAVLVVAVVFMVLKTGAA